MRMRKSRSWIWWFSTGQYRVAKEYKIPSTDRLMSRCTAAEIATSAVNFLTRKLKKRKVSSLLRLMKVPK
jgi:predicted proteasome-type protease